MDDKESLNYKQVRDAFQKLMEESGFEEQSEHFPSEQLWDVLGYAAVTNGTIHSASQALEDVPTSATVLNHLRSGWIDQHDINELNDELNELLVGQLPTGLRGKQHEIAVDIVAQPYHGEAQDDASEIRRSQAKQGTTHFHMYASVYLIRRHKRVTIAVQYWQANQSLLSVLRQLLTRLSTLEIGIKRLLVDREFASVAIMRYLDQQPFQSIMPVPARGARLKKLKQSRRSKRTRYTMSSAQNGEISFDLLIVGTYRNGRRGQHGHECLLYAVLGRPWTGSFYKLRQKYRTRFGIESSYRQLNRLRPRTSSQDPKLRLLLVMVGFCLLNLWRTLRWIFLSLPRHGGRFLDDNLFPLPLFRDFLYAALRQARQPLLSVSRPSLLNY